jgi:predicted Rdx family selenoprotein
MNMFQPRKARLHTISNLTVSEGTCGEICAYEIGHVRIWERERDGEIPTTQKIFRFVPLFSTNIIF